MRTTNTTDRLPWWPRSRDGHLYPVEGCVRPRQYHPPRAYAVLDCEGDARRFRGMGVLTQMRGWDWYESRHEAQTGLDCLPLSLDVYAHNLGYDLAVLFGQPLPAELRVRVLGDRVISATWLGHRLYDSLGLDGRPLEEIGRDLGLPKLARPEGDSEGLEPYCRRDCEIVARMADGFMAWCQVHEVPYGSRVGSIAVNAWLRHGPEPVPLAQDGDREWGRAALYPGRAEVWHEGHSDQVWTYDINAHYGDCLRGEYPDPRTGERSAGRQARPGFEEVTVVVPEGATPVLPYRSRGGQVYYPTGRWTGIYTTEELRAAEQRGTVVEAFHGGYYYSRMVEPFSAFVQSMYAERLAYRLDGDPVLAYFAKRILNSLWGRLALEAGGMREVIRGSEWEPKACGQCRACRQGKTCWHLQGLERAGPYWLRRLYTGPEPDYVNPAWAAWVSARARLRLLRLMEAAGLASLVRVHTDSVTVAPCEGGPGLLAYCLGDRLGQLKLEYSGPYEARSANVYQDDRAHVAGVPRAYQDEYFRRGQVTVRRARGFLEGLATRDIAEWQDTPVVLRQTRSARADGGARPWTVEEIEGHDHD